MPGLDRGADVVDVDVHVPGGGSPAPVPTTTSESPSRPSVSRRIVHRRRLGVEQVLHLVTDASVPVSRTGLDRAAARPGRRAAPAPARRRRPPRPARPAARKTAPAGVHDAGAGQHRQLLAGCGRARRRRRPGGGPGDRGEIVGAGPAGAVGRRRRPPTAPCPRPARATASYAASVGRRRSARASSPPAHRGRAGERVGHAAQDLRHDDAGVAPCAEQRAAGHPPHGVRRPVSRRARPRRRRPALQRRLRRGHREHQVGAGVAVRHRIDVQLVDLVLVGAERGEPTGAPAAHRGGVEGLQHAEIVLTGTDNPCPRLGVVAGQQCADSLRRSWSCGWHETPRNGHKGNHNSKIAGRVRCGSRGAGRREAVRIAGGAAGGRSGVWQAGRA